MTWIKRFDSRHPLLNMFEYFRAFTRESIGTENMNVLVTSEQGKITFYRLKEENKKLKDTWKNKFLDYNYMIQRFKWIEKIINDSEAFIKFLKDLDLNKLSNIVLHELYREYTKNFNRIFQGYHLSQPEVSAVCERELQRIIEQKIKDKKEAIKVYSLITAPTKTNLLVEEEFNWFKTILKVRKQGLTSKNLAEIKNHSKKYGWLSTQENLPFLDINYYLKLLSQNKESSKIIYEKLKNFNEDPKKVKNKRKKILKRLNNLTIKRYSFLLKEAGHLRIKKRLAWTKMAYFARPLFEEIGKRISLKPEEVMYLFPYEVEEYLLVSKEINKKVIFDRMKNHLMVMREGKLKLYTGKEAKKIQDKEIKEELLDLNILEGKCANPGFVKGRVKLIYSHSDNQLEEVEKMKQGEILVAGSTKPQLIVACRKASAIVTDEGGITSHAAIVSRELKIPCVVGTKHATKDDDLVEVDANNGTVKILNSS
jgi:phosphoenolpyruvate synthase/pyruvate phosphate dikinase